MEIYWELNVMDKNLLVLVILSAFSHHETAIDKDFSRALLSNITNENIDKQSFDNILSELAEKGYAIQGNVVQATPRGEAVAQTLGQSSLNRHDVEFINKNVELFLGGTAESKRKQLEDLLSQVNRQTLFSGQQIEKISSARLVSNSIKVNCQLKQISLIENYFDTSYVKGLRTPADRFRTLRWIERAIEEEISEKVVVNPAQNGFVVFSSMDVESATCKESTTANELTFKRTRKETLTSLSERPEILKELLIRSFTDRFKERGYAKLGDGRRFIDFSTFNPENSDIGIFRYYDGFDFRLDSVSPLIHFAWIDPTVKPMITLLDYIDYLKGSGYADPDVVQHLNNMEIRLLPSEGKGLILTFNMKATDMINERVPGSKLSFRDYWRDQHQFPLTRELQPTLEVRLGESSYNYPAETVYLDKEDVETLAGEFPLHGAAAPSPPERMKRTDQIISKLLDKPVETPFYTATFGAKLLTWEELAKEGFCSGFSRLSPPNLRFNWDRQLSTSSNDPRSVFKFGPYSKDKNAVMMMVIPASYASNQISSFFENLSSSYKRWGFGSLALESGNVIKYSSSIEKQKLGNLLANIPSPGSKVISLVVLPSYRSDLYLAFKEEIFRVAKIPVQAIQTSTFERIARGEAGPMRGLILQIYTKLLGKREAVWILSDPADQRMETLYIGMGFSSTPYTPLRANSFAAMCDSKGGEIDWKPVGIPFGGRYIDEKWFDGFLKFVRENIRAGVKRIVVFRKGETYDSEAASMEKVLSRMHDEPWGDFNFVSIINEERRIISLQELPQNPESGIFGNLNDRESILVCSLQHGLPLQQGTSVPVRLTRVLGKSPIEKIVVEYRALTYLNWSSPVSISKYPLVVNLANRIAQLVKDRSDEKMLEAYLPL